MGDDGAVATNGGSIGNEDDRKLFVGGLAQEVGEEDLKTYFANYGEVASVNVKMDQMTGRSRGFAFVVFTDEASIGPILQAEEHTIKNWKKREKGPHEARVPCGQEISSHLV